jgi:hypothetical protein
MKNLIIFLFLLRISCYGQYFGVEHTFPEQLHSSLLSEPKDGNYRVLSTKNFSSYAFLTTIHYAQVLVYNTNLQLVDSVNLPTNFIPKIEGMPVKFNNKYLWPGILREWHNGSTNSIISVLETDSTYHNQIIHKISNYGDVTSNQTIIEVTPLVRIKNSFYIGTSRLTTAGGATLTADYFTFYKINSQLNLVDSSRIFYTSPNYFSCDLISDNNQLKLLHLGLPGSCVYRPNYDRGNNIYDVDTTFNILNCKSFIDIDSLVFHNPWSPSTSRYSLQAFYARLYKLSSTKNILIGNSFFKYFYQPTDRQFTLTLFLDKQNKIIKNNLKLDSAANYSFKWQADNVSIKNNAIVTLGVKNSRYDLFHYQPQKSQMVITKFDTLGNLIWMKHHGGDMYYHPQGIIHTDDGGYLISGWRYDTSATFGQGPLLNSLETFLLKLDANGNYNSVSIQETNHLSKLNIRCFPSPANKVLYFDVPFETEIDILFYNSLGQLVLEKKNYNNRDKIDINSLSPDIYYYKIKTTNNFYTGKFVVN